MISVEATAEDASAGDKRPSARPSSMPPPHLASAGWLLRAAALSAVGAGAMGLVVAPGVRGHASEDVVVGADWMAAALSYFLAALLVALLLWGAIELVRIRSVGLFSRIALIGGGAVVVASSSPGLRDRLPPLFAVMVAAASAIATLAAAYGSVRTPHTRALAGILFALAFAAIARLGAWEMATTAGDRASVQLFNWSRWLATAGVLLEASGHMVAVTWLWTRGRASGQLGAAAAVIGAYLVTSGVARGFHSGSALWQAVLYTALSDAPGVPPPFGLDAVATFLVPSSLLLALVAGTQLRQVVPIVAALAMALVSRGSFDAPLRALCVVTASIWAVLAGTDERAMWRTLIDDRRRHLAQDGIEDRPR